MDFFRSLSRPFFMQTRHQPANKTSEKRKQNIHESAATTSGQYKLLKFCASYCIYVFVYFCNFHYLFSLSLALVFSRLAFRSLHKLKAKRAHTQRLVFTLQRTVVLCMHSSLSLREKKVSKKYTWRETAAKECSAKRQRDCQHSWKTWAKMNEATEPQRKNGKK